MICGFRYNSPVDRICCRCKRTLPLESFRFKNKSKGTRHPNCSECNKAECKRSYWSAPEDARLRVRKWIAENREAKNQRNAAYMRSYRQANGEKAREAIHQHYQKNKESYIQRARLRRERERGWLDSSFLDRVRFQFGQVCFKCGSPDDLDIDHHLALKDGGYLVPGNLTLLCGKCNNQKRFVDLYSEEEKERLRFKHAEQLTWLLATDFEIRDGCDRDLIRDLHYSGSCPGVKFGWSLFYKNRIVGTCAFSKPSRQNIKADLELSRFFLIDGTPKNTASRFLGECLRRLRKAGFRGKVISFADPTEGHAGTIYKATNWVETGFTSPNYHYETPEGQRIHKRQVWNRAKAAGRKEQEQFSLENLKRVEELPKIRFEYSIQ